MTREFLPRILLVLLCGYCTRQPESFDDLAFTEFFKLGHVVLNSKNIHCDFYENNPKVPLEKIFDIYRNSDHSSQAPLKGWSRACRQNSEGQDLNCELNQKLDNGNQILRFVFDPVSKKVLINSVECIDIP
jgi:hypothetical protein